MVMIPKPSAQELNAFEIFNAIPEEQLNWFIDNSEVIELLDGDPLFQPEEPMDHTHVILSGNIRVVLTQNNQQREIYVLEPGEITGTLPYSRAKLARAHGFSRGTSRVLSLDKKHFNTLICNHHELTTRFVHEMTSRVREFTQL